MTGWVTVQRGRRVFISSLNHDVHGYWVVEPVSVDYKGRDFDRELDESDLRAAVNAVFVWRLASAQRKLVSVLKAAQTPLHEMPQDLQVQVDQALSLNDLKRSAIIARRKHR